MYTCLSSYSETYDAVRNSVSSAASAFEAEDVVQDWVCEMVDEWFEQCSESSFKVLITGLVQNALGQVEWAHVARAFHESVQ